ncbi:MAG: hypothetical protein EU549_00580 [Promethearchaeota archaeon]|nr:MAG: hypothetical protein EU549_00580 [Candidatus Lokiarchaeota archaeon]
MNKKIKILLVILIPIIVLFSILLPVFIILSKPSIPNIDGQINTNEWKSAYKTDHYLVFWVYDWADLDPNLQTYNYLYLYADEDFLYVGVDLCGDITNETYSEVFGIDIDTINDDMIYGDNPINFSKTNARFYWDVWHDEPLLGENSFNTTINPNDVELAWSFGSSPNAAWDHRMFELKINLTALTYNYTSEGTWKSGHVQMGDRIGVMVHGYGTAATNSIEYTIPGQGIGIGNIKADYPWEIEYNYLNWEVNNQGKGITDCSNSTDKWSINGKNIIKGSKNINGQITSGEWDDAYTTRHYEVFWVPSTEIDPNLQTYNYLYLTADDDYFYIGVDLCGDITNNTLLETFGFAIDTLADCLNYQDYGVNFTKTNQRFYWDVQNNQTLVGDNVFNTTIDSGDVELAWSFGSSPNAAWDHRMFEVKVKLTALVYNYTSGGSWISGNVEIGDDIGIMIHGYGTAATNNIEYTIPSQGIGYSAEFRNEYSWDEELSYMKWKINDQGLGTTNCSRRIDWTEPEI